MNIWERWAPNNQKLQIISTSFVSASKQTIYLQKLLDVDCVVPFVGFVDAPLFQRAIDAAHGEANHVENVEQGQDTEIRPPIFIPLQAHQLGHWSQVQDPPCLKGAKWPLLSILSREEIKDSQKQMTLKGRERSTQTGPLGPS